ncbi:MAG TPA: LysR family transcriptional regulator [Candidatus Lachnoclostridium avicola]|nr:LysR family transcriptional regulator [Candidatus Lachnoclostridium avicola]
MNVRQLEIFCTLCREGSVTKTAKALYMTQPAVTHVINALEEEAGCPLFDRISRRLYLNASGRRFQEKAEQILELFGELSVNFAESEEQTPIHLGANITIANFWLPKVWAEFSRRYPRTPVQVTVDSAVRIEEELLAYRLDFGFLEGNIRSSRLESVEFGSYQVGVYVSPAHPLALRPSCGPEELIRERLLLREKGSAVRDVFDHGLYGLGLSAEPACTSVNTQALVRLAEEGLGAAVLPEPVAEPEVQAGRLVQVPVDGLSMENRMRAAWVKERTMTSQMKRLMELIQKRT